MAQILSTITCDLGRGSCTPSSVRVMQYDSDIRYIAVKFLDKGQAWAIPSGFAVKLRMMKSDGTPTCKPVDNVTGNTAQFQVTADMTAQETFEREMKPLRAIRDNYPKVVLTLDRFTPGDYEGIQVLQVTDWLLGK